MTERIEDIAPGDVVDLKHKRHGGTLRLVVHSTDPENGYIFTDEDLVAHLAGWEIERIIPLSQFPTEDGLYIYPQESDKVARHSVLLIEDGKLYIGDLLKRYDITGDQRQQIMLTELGTPTKWTKE